MTRCRWAVLLSACALAGACSRTPAPNAAPSSEAARYAALPDTLVCVVDRTTERGLRNLTAKRAPDGEALVLISGSPRPLSELHPVGIVAGYAGRERWYTGNEPITVQGRRYTKVQGDRRIPLESLRMGGEFRAIPLYVDPADTQPPRAVYAPVRPGCVFQAYVREDAVGR